ncbi:MAG: UPF0721 transmembrane protein [Thermonema sp.]|uniref:sulfite exporter TauE/SafE family protein n=1 Tax=Thermonema sp. TaxID=2231181 RepID=UPI0021DF1272|nr:sulfite exporter TauE/SafE family protein [Thermonema sp.]GIV39070.1 MAG: UPF0721 transmembrane protein [Thermonema sp.]
MLDELILFSASLIVGVINTLAGSGSLIMLPLLIWIGLPAPIANGTNRVAVALQSLVGLWQYGKNYDINYREAVWVLTPVLMGSLSGAYIATQVSAKVIEGAIGVLIVVMLGMTLLNPKRWLRESEEYEQRYKSPLWQVVLFAIGVYAGFIQAGSGIFLIIVMVMGLKFNLKRANAYKLVSMAAFGLPVLFIFASQGQVNWHYGSISAAGQMIGAVAGARFATRYPKANQWIYGLVVVMLIAVLVRYYELYRWFFPAH